MQTAAPELEHEDVVDVAELVPYEPRTPAASGLFGTDDPDLAVARAVKVADALARVLAEQNLTVRIRGKQHVLVEGWTLLGSMLGVFPVLDWTRPLPEGWEARVEARTLDGRVVGAAESECLRSESRWAKADDYAVRSMAATRATSKALRGPLGFVVTMAGFDTTPAEEIPAEPEPEPPLKRSPVAPVAATRQQVDEIRALIRSLEECAPDVDWRARAQEISGVPAGKLTHAVADGLIGRLQARLAELVDNREPDA